MRSRWAPENSQCTGMEHNAELMWRAAQSSHPIFVSSGTIYNAPLHQGQPGIRSLTQQCVLPAHHMQQAVSTAWSGVSIVGQQQQRRQQQQLGHVMSIRAPFVKGASPIQDPRSQTSLMHDYFEDPYGQREKSSPGHGQHDMSPHGLTLKRVSHSKNVSFDAWDRDFGETLQAEGAYPDEMATNFLIGPPPAPPPRSFLSTPPTRPEFRRDFG